MGLLRKFLTKNRPSTKQDDTTVVRTQPYLTQTVTYGPRRVGDDPSVCFVDERRGIYRTIVDQGGNIRDFPGIVQEGTWVKDVSPNALLPEVHFETRFEARDDGWLVLWEIQPDGRYWEDESGFGAEQDVEVVLYTFLDREGNFTGPFKLYKYGIRRFYPKEEPLP